MADIVTSQTRIANRALDMLGTATRIISVEDESPIARQVRDLWHETRRAAIVSHPWNFAIFRALLNESAARPAFGYSRQFLIPADALRWLPPASGDDDYFLGEREGDFILTDCAGPLPFRGIRDVPDVTRWSAQFDVMMAAQLAFDLANSVTQFQSMVNDMAMRVGDALESARGLDGLETGNRTRGNAASQSRWVTARQLPYRGGGRGIHGGC